MRRAILQAPLIKLIPILTALAHINGKIEYGAICGYPEGHGDSQAKERDCQTSGACNTAAMTGTGYNPVRLQQSFRTFDTTIHKITRV